MASILHAYAATLTDTPLYVFVTAISEFSDLKDIHHLSEHTHIDENNQYCFTRSQSDLKIILGNWKAEVLAISFGSESDCRSLFLEIQSRAPSLLELSPVGYESPFLSQIYHVGLFVFYSYIRDSIEAFGLETQIRELSNIATCA